MMFDGDFGKLSPELTTHITSIQQVSNNLADLVSMILDVSRIQLGKMRVDLTDINLKDAIEEILDVVNPKAEERGVNLKVTLSELAPTIRLDKRLFRMTLENLLSNAIKYSGEPHGEVVFDLQMSNGLLSYYVKDNGCGIPIEDQGKVFGKLFRASNVQNIDGNGFGLYAAKGAVEALGGNIRFESEEGKGTTFYVQMPVSK